MEHSVYKVHALDILYSHHGPCVEVNYRLDYHWRFLPKNATGNEHVYVRNRKDGYALLTWWNRQGDWVYWTTD